MKGSAQKFFNKAIRNNGKSRIINIDKSGVNTAGIKTWNKRNFTRKKIKIRRVEYLNKIIEQDHRIVKRRIATSTRFKEFEAAQKTLPEIEITNMIRKDQILKPKPSLLKLSTP